MLVSCCSFFFLRNARSKSENAIDVFMGEEYARWAYTFMKAKECKRSKIERRISSNSLNIHSAQTGKI